MSVKRYVRAINAKYPICNTVENTINGKLAAFGETRKGNAITENMAADDVTSTVVEVLFFRIL